MGVLPGTAGEEPELNPEKEAQRAFERGMKALNRRPYTQAVMTDLLTESGFNPDAVAAAVERLVDIGALDDAAYAREYATEKRDLAGWGSVRIAETLRRRGVAEHHIEAALADDDRESQLARAVGLLETRGPIDDDDRDRNRALGYLTRRGYDLDLAYEAIRRYTNG